MNNKDQEPVKFIAKGVVQAIQNVIDGQKCELQLHAMLNSKDNVSVLTILTRREVVLLSCWYG
jgi:hypothetical protein